MAVATEGLSRLRVGGARLSLIDSAEKIASTAPAAPRRWPIADLVDDMETLPAALPNSRSTAASSISSPIGVDVVDVGWLDAGALYRRDHAAIGAVAVLGGRRDVEGVAGKPVADDLGINLGAARLSVLKRIDHHHAGALAHDETVAIAIVGT